MVRFRVVKASHVLLVVSVLILAAVLIFIVSQESSSIGAGAQLQSGAAGDEVVLTSIPASAVSSGLQIAVVPEAAPESAEPPSILIYHTHTHEAYAQVDSDPYVAVEAWRTMDPAHSVVQVGSVLAEELRSLGYQVVHDTTDHELDDINQAYVRSLETLQSYVQRFDLCIDLHRDAYSDGLKRFVTDEDGAEYAQLMLLVGRGDAYTGAEKPDYDNNLYFAQLLTRKLNAHVADLCRNVTIKKGRYNQHLSCPMILLEAGHNLNTLDQALASMPHAAQAIHEALSEFKIDAVT